MKPRRAPAAPKTTWLGRVARGRRPDRNPLRRASDRLETAVLGLLLAAFFAAAPFAAQAAGNQASAWFGAEQRAQVSAVHQVRAVVLQTPVNWNAYVDGMALGAMADARWTAPDGHPRTGVIPVPDNAKAGSTVLVWTDQAGEPANPPMRHAQVAGRVALAEGLAVFALAVALITVAGLVRWALNRRRLAAWDADWLATGPRWSPRR